MAEPLLRVDALTKRFGGLAASDALSLEVAAGGLHAVIGPNGAGKTTLVSQLCGEIVPDSGAIYFGNRKINALSAAERVRVGLARSFQVSQLLFEFTVLENVLLAVQARRGHSFRFWGDPRRNSLLRDESFAALARVGLEQKAAAIVGFMSHGEQKQLELAVALATQPRLLLLDEPMAGLGAAECAQTVELLKGLKGDITIVLVEHDMDAVFALADSISVLVSGRCILTGDADTVRNNEAVRTAYLGEGEI